MFGLLCLVLLAGLAAGSGSPRRNFTTLARAAGMDAQEYEVLTDDNYYLKLFRVSGAGRPVLLMHGTADSADTFVLRGNASLAAHLAARGRDVWVGNARGTRYGRRHLYLDPDRDDEFWDYSLHEIGASDLPAIVDFVLNATGHGRLSAVGHAQGNTIFYVLGSLRPEYNSKIDVLVALAPALVAGDVSPAVAALAGGLPLVGDVLAGEEVFGDASTARALYERLCGGARGYQRCARASFPVAGAAKLGADFFPVLVRHFPAATSRKSLQHAAQVKLRGIFAQYDYGALNVELYNSSQPPPYELKRVTMPVVLLVGRSDGAAAAADAAALRAGLPRAEVVVLPRARLDHAAAVWGRRMDRYLFPDVDRILQQFAGGPD